MIGQIDGQFGGFFACGLGPRHQAACFGIKKSNYGSKRGLQRVFCVPKLLIDHHCAFAWLDNGTAPDHHAAGCHLAVKTAMFFKRHRTVAAVTQSRGSRPKAWRVKNA